MVRGGDSQTCGSLKFLGTGSAVSSLFVLGGRCILVGEGGGINA